MAKKIRLDFSKVEERSGWNTKQIPEGVHKMKVASVQETEASDGTDMLVYSLVPADPRYKTRNFPFYCKLQPNQLWKLRDLIVAAGGTVPKRAGQVDPNSPVGKFIACEVSDETGQYAGRSSVDGTYDLSILDEDGADASDDAEDDEEYEGDDEDEEVEDDEDEEADEEDEDEEDLDTLSLPELRKRAKEAGVAKTVGLKKPQLIEAILEAEAEEDDEDEDEDLDDEDLEDDDLDDEELYEDDEEEEEAPAPKRKAPARKPAAKAAPAKTARRVVRR